MQRIGLTTGLTIALLLALAAPVSGQYEVTLRAHEVRLSELRLPASESGSLAFKACDECEYVTRRVTPGTRWEINGKAVRLEEFRTLVETISDRAKSTVTVGHDLTADVISDVSIAIR